MACLRVALKKISEGVSVRAAASLPSTAVAKPRGVELALRKTLEIRTEADVKHVSLSAKVIDRPVISIREVCMEDFLPEEEKRFICYGSTDSLPTTLPSGDTIAVDGYLHTFTSESGMEYVWVAVPEGSSVLRWENTLDAQEDLVEEDFLTTMEMDGYTLYYFHMLSGIGSTYKITVK